MLAELSLKAETVEDRVLDLEEKSQKISALDVELRKKLEVYD